VRDPCSPPLCILIFVFRVTGNAMTILIIQEFKDMKTLNIYCSCPAWPFSPCHMPLAEAVCYFHQHIFKGCTSATILHTYLAISFNLWSNVVVTRHRVQYIILALWGFALGTLFYSGIL
uniref:Uncharacterized protein n=1 Tax=Monopterus albus TaxID=43700 RepID=A0A3Q3J8W8_MONAL